MQPVAIPAMMTWSQKVTPLEPWLTAARITWASSRVGGNRIAQPARLESLAQGGVLGDRLGLGLALDHGALGPVERCRSRQGDELLAVSVGTVEIAVVLAVGVPRRLSLGQAQVGRVGARQKHRMQLGDLSLETVEATRVLAQVLGAEDDGADGNEGDA